MFAQTGKEDKHARPKPLAATRMTEHASRTIALAKAREEGIVLSPPRVGCTTFVQNPDQPGPRMQVACGWGGFEA